MNFIKLTLSSNYSTKASGNGEQLSGTLLGQDGNPREKTLMLMKETGSKAGNVGPTKYQSLRIIRSDSSGQWAFKNLYPGLYTVIAYDNTGEFDPVIKGGLVPEPME